MTFSSAYIFAKQITSTTPQPSGNVYFENGLFNKNLIPEGFTNYNDMVVTFTGAVGSLNYQITSGQSVLTPFIGTPRIAMLKGEHGDVWNLDGNVIRKIHTDPIPLGADTYNDYSTSILFPVNIPNTYRSAHIIFGLAGSWLDGNGEDINMLWQGKNPQTQVLYNYVINDGTYGMSADELQEYEISIEIPDKSSRPNFAAYRYVEFSPYLATSEIYIKKIWFE